MNRGDYVIVRGDKSGVFAGYLAEKNGKEIKLTKARKLWYWDGAAAVEQLSFDGVSKPENCKFTLIVDEIIILDSIQVLKCTKKAKENIERIPEWRK